MEKTRVTSSGYFLETCHASVTTTEDALLIFEACKQGILPFTTRRFLDCEKDYIRSGSVFVFDEVESGIHRWTDGRIWSPSRINGNFLVYREATLKLSWRPNRSRELFSRLWHFISPSGSDASQSKLGKFNLPWPLDNDESALEQLRDGSNMFERKTYEIKLALARLFKYFPEIRDVDLSQVLNSNKGLYLLKPNGMIKRTISIKINNQHCHLVAYQDSTQGASLASPYPKDIPLLSGLQISDQLYKYSNLRCPVKQKFESKITQAASTQSSPRLSSQVQSDSACTSEQHSHNPPSSPCISLVKEELTEDIETLLTESSYSPLNSPINSAAATLATSTAAEVGALNHSMMDTKPFLADIKHGPFLSGHSCPECYPSRTATPANTPDSNYCSPLSNICHDQLHIRMSTQHDLTEPPINVSRCYGNSIHNHHIRSPSGTAECVVSSTTLAVLSSSILNPTVSSDIHESILDWLKQDITSVNHYVTPQHVSTMTSSSSMVADFEYNSSNNNNQLRNSIQPMALSTLNDIIQREEAINNI